MVDEFSPPSQLQKCMKSKGFQDDSVTLTRESVYCDSLSNGWVEVICREAAGAQNLLVTLQEKLRSVTAITNNLK